MKMLVKRQSSVYANSPNHVSRIFMLANFPVKDILLASFTAEPDCLCVPR